MVHHSEAPVIHTFMKPILITLFTLCLLLTACTTTTSDASIRRHLVGAWTSDSRPGRVIENRSDGTVVVRENGVETAKARWEVKDGYIISGIGSGTVESNKVLRVSADEVVIEGLDGHPQLTWHRQ